MQCRILAYSFFLLTWVSLPAKDLGIQVHAILETHCAECHGRNSSKPPKPILDKTTDLFRLRADADYVVAGKAGESDLMYRVTTDHKEDRMPPGKKSAPRPKLSGAEVSILGNWINGGGEPAREYISEKQVLETVLEDIRKIPQKERSDLRYLTLHNLHNLPPDIEPAANLDIYRAGVAKLLNSLSWEKELAVPEPVGKSGAVLRIRLSKYGWNDDMWEYVAAHNPYGQVYAGLEGSIEKESGVEGQLVLRMDWFTFACAQPPGLRTITFWEHRFIYPRQSESRTGVGRIPGGRCRSKPTKGNLRFRLKTPGGTICGWGEGKGSSIHPCYSQRYPFRLQKFWGLPGEPDGRKAQTQRRTRLLEKL